MSEERARPETRAYAGVADGAVAIGEVVSVQIKSNFWHSWTQIAIRHEQEARRARAKLVARWGAPDAGIHMPEEMQASMVSLVAVAFALDALHFEVAPSSEEAAILAREVGRHGGINSIRSGWRCPG